MQRAARRVEHERKRREKGDKGDDARVEEVFSGKHVGELGVEDREADGHRQVDPGLEEGDDLGAGAGGGNDEDVLGITKDGVIVENAARIKEDK